MSENGLDPVRIALIGAGSRGLGAYGAHVLRRPDLARIVAVADRLGERLALAGHLHDISPAHLYPSWEAMLDCEPAFDAVIIATPDREHLAPALATIERAAGISLLLEKPICPTEEEMERLATAVEASGADVTVAHVLRYTAFFARIRELLDRGVIGQLLSIRHTEHVGYWHFAHSYVRGNWRRLDEASPMLLAKACHDLDILRWLAGAPCTHVASFGTLSHFTSANAPAGSTARCDQGCRIERTCPYSAQRIYLETLPPASAWPHDVVSADTSPAALARALHEGPYGRCVYHCDNDVADHQVVALRFANGVDATLNVSAFTRETTRTVHLMGSHGEITGDFYANAITVADFRNADTRTSRLTLVTEGYHGGGDDGLMVDFLNRVRERRRNGKVEEAPTALAESLDSHRMAFAAERARHSGDVIRLGA
ncbi:MAG: Gfo/Idh/MocA family oxidoreductase [Rhodospirillales bacterium]|nr:Gfo/Idh/MocA family oxidoreductase [Rhodospirillales bacterium]